MDSVELELEEASPLKLKKSEDMDGEEIDGEDPVPVDEDSSFLNNFLSKRPVNNLSMFQRVLLEEEIQARERDPSEDTTLFRDACSDFSDCVGDIATLKATKPLGWKEDVVSLRKEGTFITLIMKKLNRVEKIRTKMYREVVGKEKQQADISLVKLDNMLSEILHLRREIDKCLKFRSRSLGIDLVSLKEFYEKAPPSISKPEITKTDEHQQQLARLEWELKQRKELAALLNSLENKKSALSEQIEKKEKDLSSIGPLVNDVISVSQPLKEKLGSSFKNLDKVNDEAYLLPDPLYYLYVQGSAFRDASGQDISLEIKGNFLEAQKFKKLLETGGDISSSGSTSGKNSPDIDKNKLLTKHPLSVHLKLTLKGGYNFDLEFLYYPHLNIATLKPAVTAPSNLKMPSSSDVLLNPKNLFCELFSGDSGLDSPNLMNYFQMQKVGLDSLPTEKIGIPFIWVQKLVGLNFLGQTYRIQPKVEICRSNISVIFKELKKRCIQRMSLLTMISALEGGNVTPSTNAKSGELSSRLTQIKGVTWEEYKENPLSERHKDTNLINPLDLFFMANVTRGEATLTCLIAVKPDHPQSPSIFSVKIGCKTLIDEKLAAKLSLDAEKEINCNEPTRTKGLTISDQLYHGMVYFDHLLEGLDPEKFQSINQQEFSVRGRNRTLFQISTEER